MFAKKYYFLVTIASVLILTLAVVVIYQNNSNDHISANVQKKRQELIKGINSNIVGLEQSYEVAQGAEKEKTKKDLIAATQNRKTVLEEIINNEPENFFINTLPDSIRQKIPKEAKKYIEEETQVEGELEVLHYDDFNHNSAKNEYNLKVKDKKYRLFFGRGEPKVLTGSKLKVKGYIIEQFIGVSIVDGSSFQLLSAPTPRSDLMSGLTPIKVAVVLFNFQSRPAQPFTPDYAKSMVFGQSNSVNAYYQETSFNKIGLTGKVNADGDVYGWYTIADSDAWCNSSIWAGSAQTIAKSQGADLSGYNSIIFVFPYTPSCSWAGSANIGSYSGKVYINGSFSIDTVGHELGHNFGVHHASSYACKDANGLPISISNNCTVSEYGDWYDIMGNHGVRHMNNFHKAQLDWLSALNTKDVSQDGIYTLAPIEKSSTETQLVRIARNIILAGNDERKYYYLEFRQPFGFDNFSSTANVVNGVSIRLGPDYNYALRSLLLDTTPTTSGLNDQALAINSIFADSLNNITIKTISVTPERATVEIKFGTVPCVATNSLVEIVPSSGPLVPAGTPVDYTVNITNMNNGSCSPATFALSSIIPSGWSGSFSPTTLSIASGSKSSAKFTLTSPTTATNGNYSFTIESQDQTNLYYGLSSASYWVKNPEWNLTLKTDQSSYARNSYVYATAELKYNNQQFSGATVDFVLTQPNQKYLTATKTTSSTGIAIWNFKLKGNAPIGQYILSATAKSGGNIVGSTSTVFTVF